MLTYIKEKTGLDLELEEVLTSKIKFLEMKFWRKWESGNRRKSYFENKFPEWLDSPFCIEFSANEHNEGNLVTPVLDDEDIKRHINEDIKSGIIQPLPATVFPAHKMEEAFRFLLSGKHIGKVLLQIRENETACVTVPLSVQPQVYFSPNEVYIVPGGLGGFGLELVDWMILRGARKIVLSSSRGITTDYQNLRIALWKSYGCDILVNTANIASMDGCLELLTISLKKGPVGGIFNLAVLLKDSVFQNQSPELFQQAFGPKAFATIYLDQLSRKLCQNLRHFVIFSSVSCGRGNAGQSNYGMANSIMERIIEDRIESGFPGKAIQWGAVGEVGLVAEMAAGKVDVEIGGTLQQRISSCLMVLDSLLTSRDAIVSSMVVAEKKANTSLQTPLEFVLNTLCIRDIKSVSMNAKLSELGLDSLTSVEIRQAFERDYNIILNTSDLRSLTISKLVEISETALYGGAVVEEQRQDFIEHMRQFYGQIGELLFVKSTFQKASNIEVGIPVIVLPGIDGCGGSVWNTIGEKITLPFYVLQYQQASGAKSLREIVQFCSEKVIECLHIHKSTSFKIIGYSLGALLGHFVALDLEKHGFQGKMIFIDGSPLFIQNLITSLQKVYEGIELEKIALSTMLSLILPSLDVQQIKRDIQYKLFKEEILRYMHDQLVQHNYPETNEIMSKIEAIYQRLKIIQNPETFANIGVIDAEILLLKPTFPTLVDFDENFGLSPFTRNEVLTQIIEGNHQSILQNSDLPHIINKFFMD